MRMSIRHALLNLSAAKLRSFLAVLGILVGTASVVTLVSLAELATAKALDQFRALGTELLSISVYPRTYQDPKPENTLSLADIGALEDQLNQVRGIAPYTNIFLPINFHGRKIKGKVIGATENLRKALKMSLKSGDFVSYYHRHQRFCVIGHEVAKQLHARSMAPLIGQQVWLGQTVYTIIGELDPWKENAFFNANANRTIFIPIENTQMIDSKASIQNMIAMLKHTDHIDTLKKQIERLIHRAAPELKVFIRSPAQIIENMEKQSQIFTLLLGLIGGISLLVGGIGIMNIMLVSVAERRREIGIIKAVGATRKHIIYLFLTEAVILSLFGGGFGVITGIVLSNTIAYFAHWGFAIYLLPLAIGFFVSFTTGVFFGIYPAYRAAGLNPIEALRYE